MPLYCARLLVACLVDDNKSRKRNTCDHAFVLLTAEDYEQAFQRALALGKKQETRYKNEKGQTVRWAFVRVEEIKELPEDLNGQEIGSLLDVLETGEPIRFNKRFLPKRFRPLLS